MRSVKLVRKQPLCRALTDYARSSCHITWDRRILGNFFRLHTFNIAWTPGRGSRTIWKWLKKRFVSIRVRKCWKNMMAVPQKTSQVTNQGSMRMSPKQMIDHDFHFNWYYFQSAIDQFPCSNIQYKASWLLKYFLLLPLANCQKYFISSRD